MGRKKGVILSYVLMIFEVLSTLLLTPLIIRSLGSAEYGVYKLFASIVTYLTLLDLGIGNSIIRYAAKYKATNDEDNMNRFVGDAQCFYAIMALVALLIGAVLVVIFPTVFATGLSESEIALGQTLLEITVINTAVTLFTAVYPNIIIGYGLFSVSKGLSIVQIIIRIIVTYVALLLGFRSIAIVTINMCLTVLCRGVMAAYTYLKLKIKPKLKGVDKAFVSEIVGYSFWILLQMIATQINAYADQVLLGMFVTGASAVIAVYSIGTQIVQYYQSIGSAVSGVLMPGVVSMVERGASAEQLENEMVRIGRMSLAVLAAIFGGFMLYGKQFILLWAGEEYSNGFAVAAILMFAQMIIYIESIGTQILWAKNEHKEQSILKIAIVLLNIILAIALIKWNALIGATIGTFISLMLGDVIVMNIVFRKKIGIKLGRYYKKLINGIIPAVLLATTVNFFFKQIGLNGWGGFLINICVYVVTLGLLYVIFGLNANEKDLLKKILKIQR